MSQICHTYLYSICIIVLQNNIYYKQKRKQKGCIIGENRNGIHSFVTKFGKIVPSSNDSSFPMAFMSMCKAIYVIDLCQRHLIGENYCDMHIIVVVIFVQFGPV